MEYINLTLEMVDSKDCSYLHEFLEIMTILMEKASQDFLISSIREGIKSSLEEIERISDKDLYIPSDGNEALLKSAESYLGLKEEDSEIISEYIQKRASDILHKYFSEEKIKFFLLSHNYKEEESPEFIFNSLLINSNQLKNKKEWCTQLVQETFNKILEDYTCFELEKSEIILNLASYIDENYLLALKSGNSFQIKQCEDKIFQKVSDIISLFNMDRIKEIIKKMQFCVTSLNSFSICLNDTFPFRNSAGLFMANYCSQKIKQKITFNYIPNQDTMDYHAIDYGFSELHNYYKTSRCLEVDYKETFGSVAETLLQIELSKDLGDFYLGERKVSVSEDFISSRKVLTSYLEKKNNILDDLDGDFLEAVGSHNLRQKKTNRFTLNFFIEIKSKKIYIDKIWNVNDLIKEVRENFSKRDFNDFLINMTINFEILAKEELSFGLERKSSMNVSTKLKMNEEDSVEDILTKNIKENYVEEIIFHKFYQEKIIKNTALYSVERVSPYLFIISLLEIAVNSFGDLFKISDRIPKDCLVNNKVSSLLTKQLRDPYAISANKVPNWCKAFCLNFPYMTDLTTRLLFFKTSTFDLKRSMTNLYVYVKTHLGESLFDDKTLAKSKRKKITVQRENILTHLDTIVKENSAYSGYLEFDYEGENGSGIGPTLEFYSIVILTLSDDKSLWYKTTDNSLFPAPYLAEEKQKNFVHLGFIVGRSLYDDRLIDLPLNPLFWDLLLNRPVSLAKLNMIDSDLGKVIRDFLMLINKKKDHLGSDNLSVNKISELTELRYNGHKIEDMEVYFTIPGYLDFPLVDNGENILVSADNLEEYVNSLYNSLLYAGIKDSLYSFRKGFELVFSLSSLECFSSSELVELFSCHSEWNYDMMYQHICPNHGYDKSSRVFNYLLKFLKVLDKNDRKDFLLFVTGSPRLPLGGFKNLSPKMTIVKRTPDKANECPDNYLPTVMTCQNYLKIPEYSSYEIFEMRMRTAIKEGKNSFDLS